MIKNYQGISDMGVVPTIGARFERVSSETIKNKDN
jgi:hypothetical protein